MVCYRIEGQKTRDQDVHCAKKWWAIENQGWSIFFGQVLEYSFEVPVVFLPPPQKATARACPWGSTFCLNNVTKAGTPLIFPLCSQIDKE